MVGSLACAVANSLGAFVGARFIQGMGGSMMTPVARLVLVRATERNRLVEAMAWLTVPALIGPMVGRPFRRVPDDLCELALDLPHQPADRACRHCPVAPLPAHHPRHRQWPAGRQRLHPFRPGRFRHRFRPFRRQPAGIAGPDRHCGNGAGRGLRHPLHQARLHDRKAGARPETVCHPDLPGQHHLGLARAAGFWRDALPAAAGCCRSASAFRPSIPAWSPSSARSARW